jgi:hypothetical protein
MWGEFLAEKRKFILRSRKPGHGSEPVRNGTPALGCACTTCSMLTCSIAGRSNDGITAHVCGRQCAVSLY